MGEIKGATEVAWNNLFNIIVALVLYFSLKLHCQVLKISPHFNKKGREQTVSPLLFIKRS